MLTIKVMTYKDAPVDPPISAQFREEGGSIGRSPDCTLVLPDPERAISRVHAAVVHASGRFLLRDQGSMVPVVINGAAVGKGNERVLAAGDELRVGGYALLVEGAAAENADDDTTTIFRQGTMLSWSEEGFSPAAQRIASVIVPAPTGARPLTPQAAPAALAAPVVGSVPSPPLSAATAVESEVAAADQALLAALLRGAGVTELDLPAGLTPEFMEDLGAVMRETMRGVLDLLAARATAKREVRADATVIVAQDNNPLKFAPGVDAAVAHLLEAPAPGFMDAQRSLADARASLCLHQEGFVAGMRAALESVLARFDPGALEARLNAAAPASFMAMNQKARLWAQYEAFYAEMAREAETDFHFLFGKEFLAAYHARTKAPPRAPDAA